MESNLDTVDVNNQIPTQNPTLSATVESKNYDEIINDAEAFQKEVNKDLDNAQNEVDKYAPSNDPHSPPRDLQSAVMNNFDNASRLGAQLNKQCPRDRIKARKEELDQAIDTMKKSKKTIDDSNAGDDEKNSARTEFDVAFSRYNKVKNEDEYEKNNPKKAATGRAKDALLSFSNKFPLYYTASAIESIAKGAIGQPNDNQISENFKLYNLGKAGGQFLIKSAEVVYNKFKSTQGQDTPNGTTDQNDPANSR